MHSDSRQLHQETNGIVGVSALGVGQGAAADVVCALE